MSTQTDPLRTLLENARSVGDEWCWPASQASEVIEALGLLNRLILGIELWEFDEEHAGPKVLGWTEWPPADHGDWTSAVQASVEMAQMELERNLPHNTWVNITWARENDLDGAGTPAR